MRSSSFLVACLAVTVDSLTNPALSGVADPTARYVPGGYIVELENTPNPKQIGFYANLSASNIAVTPRMTLDHTFFNGLSFIIDEAHDNSSTMKTIQSFALVKKIWPMRLYSTPTVRVESNISWKGQAVGSSISKRGVVKRADEDDYVVHTMGGVNKLRNDGYSGEGLFIGIVDTGVDYNHPSLGGGFGPGFKVAAGFDLVGDAYDATNAPIPDDDPMDCIGHGTHVAGIVGANDDPLGFSGVVPNATLGIWKVFGCADAVGTDVLIAGFNMAFEAGVDIITCSVGGRNGWSEDPWDVVVQRIEEAGVPCTIAIGNDGANGLFDTSGAGDSLGAIGVGSVMSVGIPLAVAAGSFEVAGEVSAFGYLPSTDPGGNSNDFTTISLPLYALTFDTTIVNDGCSALPASTPDLSDVIVLIRRGTCLFDTKIANAVAFGAQRILFYDNVSGELISPATTSTTSASGMVDSDQGAEWISLLSANQTVTIDFTDLANTGTFAIQLPNTSGTAGTMSVFSSWGPTNEMHIKPEVSAPGQNILSTFPIALGSYAVFSGTSMATPYIAGCVALIKQVAGNLTPTEITNRLATTANLMLFNDGNGASSNFLAPVVQQGGGLVDVYSAAHFVTLINMAKIELNDTANFVSTHTFTISNTGSEDVTYELSNIGAAAAYAFGEDMVVVPTPYPIFPPDMDSEEIATIVFDSPSITIAAKSSAIVSATFTAPTGLENARIPIYSGWIGINGSNGESLTLPYAGALGSLKALNFFSGEWKLALYDDSFNDVLENDTFIMAGLNTSFVPPRLLDVSWEPAMGSLLVRLDIVPDNTTGLPLVLGMPILGSFPGFPLEGVPRQGVLPDNIWDGSLDTGDFVPAGRYQFLLRALRIFGDSENPDDFQSVESLFVNVEYA